MGVRSQQDMATWMKPGYVQGRDWGWSDNISQKDLLWLPFTEGNGYPRDISGNDLVPTSMSGATWEPGPNGYAMAFSGASGQGLYYTLADTVRAGLGACTGPYAIFMVINIGSVTGSIGGFGSRIINTQTNGDGYSVFTRAGAEILWTSRNAAGIDTAFPFGDNDFAVNEWVSCLMIMGTDNSHVGYDSTDSTIHGPSAAAALRDSDVTTDKLIIGNGLGLYGDFKLSELRIFIPTAAGISSRNLVHTYRPYEQLMLGSE